MAFIDRINIQYRIRSITMTSEKDQLQAGSKKKSLKDGAS
jgi:hypothetical protein